MHSQEAPGSPLIIAQAIQVIKVVAGGLPQLDEPLRRLCHLRLILAAQPGPHIAPCSGTRSGESCSRHQPALSMQAQAASVHTAAGS